ncbi:MAG: 5-formyltetrahydrofolate cyclo-ligase [Thermodesulfobacteriota bacterium]
MRPEFPMPTDRASLRAAMLARRDQLSPEARREKSAAITHRLLTLPELRAAAMVMAYVSFRSEVETMPFIAACLDLAMQVAVPRTLVAKKRLEPRLITDPGRDLAPGYCRIPEPLPTLPLADPRAIELVIVPGSAFDADGGRMGYGGGYYDRFLQQAAPQALRVGVAFDLQMLERLPLEPHDQRLHVLITESSTFRPGRPAP